MPKPDTNSYPEEQEFSHVFIQAYNDALPATTLSNPGHSRDWALAATCAGVLAVMRALAEQAAATAEQTQTS
jgi:hypothetical protein